MTSETSPRRPDTTRPAAASATSQQIGDEGLTDGPEAKGTSGALWVRWTLKHPH